MDIFYWKKLLSNQIDILLKDKTSILPKWLELEIDGDFESFQFSNKIFPQFYFKSREENYQFLSFGEARSYTGGNSHFDWISDFEHFQKKLPKNCLIHMGGGFDINRCHTGKKVFSLNSPWEGFSTIYFTAPRITLYQRNNQLVLCCFVDEKAGELPDLLMDCLNSTPVDTFFMPKVIRRQDCPSKESWMRIVNEVINEIKATSLEKVVLARKVEIFLDGPIHLLKWRELLKKNEKNSYTAYFRLDKDKCFFTLSPERLIKVSGLDIKTEALAGTHPRGASAKEDAQIEKKLLDSNKDKLEHQYVIDFLKKVLRPYLIGEINESKTTILKLTQVQHLKTDLQGLLKSNEKIFKLIFNLHPTPAVGGVPTPDAKEIICQKEGFDRGWYTGILGWIKGEENEFIVNIRSCLINGPRLSIFSGAGIVKDSNPEIEWEEIEQKIKIYLNCF